MNTKNNQRYQNSDIRMKSAMLELMTHTPFEKITVKQICEKAGVNRGTFYSHYTDIYSMLNEIEDRLDNELIKISQKWNNYSSEITLDFFIPYIKYIKDHQYFYRIALTNQRALPIQKSFKPLWKRIVGLQKVGTDKSKLIYLFIYFQASVMMVLKQWIETGCEKSEEEMAAILVECVPKKLFHNN